MQADWDTNCIACCSAPRVVRLRPCGHALYCGICTIKAFKPGAHLECATCKAGVAQLEYGGDLPPSVTRMPTDPQPALANAVTSTPLEFLTARAASGDEVMADAARAKLEGEELEGSDDGGVYLEEEEDALIQAARDGDLDRVQLLLHLDAGNSDRDPEVNINATDADEVTALIAAAHGGHREVVTLLLAADGINVNAASVSGNTALICAAQQGHTEVVSLLVAADEIDVNAGSATALMWAVHEGHTQVVTLLLAADGIDVNAVDASGKTALICAAHRGRAEVVTLLLGADGIDVNAADASGGTALICAADKGRAEVVTLLVAAAGIDVNAADVSGYTALICAAHRGRAEVVTLLLAADGIDVNAEDSRRKTALQYASAKGHAAAVELLRRKRPRK